MFVDPVLDLGTNPVGGAGEPLSPPRDRPHRLPPGGGCDTRPSPAKQTRGWRLLCSASARGRPVCDGSRPQPVLGREVRPNSPLVPRPSPRSLRGPAPDSGTQSCDFRPLEGRAGVSKTSRLLGPLRTRPVRGTGALRGRRNIELVWDRPVNDTVTRSETSHSGPPSARNRLQWV